MPFRIQSEDRLASDHHGHSLSIPASLDSHQNVDKVSGVLEFLFQDPNPPVKPCVGRYRELCSRLLSFQENDQKVGTVIAP